jgi:polyhydroxyalkanoate synthesis regulator phasin
MVSEDVEILSDMLTALVDILVEKGLLTQEEYEDRVKILLEKSAKLTRFDDLEE